MAPNSSMPTLYQQRPSHAALLAEAATYGHREVPDAMKKFTYQQCFNMSVFDERTHRQKLLQDAHQRLFAADLQIQEQNKQKKKLMRELSKPALSVGRKYELNSLLVRDNKELSKMYESRKELKKSHDVAKQNLEAFLIWWGNNERKKAPTSGQVRERATAHTQTSKTFLNTCQKVDDNPHALWDRLDQIHKPQRAAKSAGNPTTESPMAKRKRQVLLDEKNLEGGNGGSDEESLPPRQTRPSKRRRLNIVYDSEDEKGLHMSSSPSEPRTLEPSASSSMSSKRVHSQIDGDDERHLKQQSPSKKQRTTGKGMSNHQKISESKGFHRKPCPPPPVQRAVNAPIEGATTGTGALDSDANNLRRTSYQTRKRTAQETDRTDKDGFKAKRVRQAQSSKKGGSDIADPGQDAAKAPSRKVPPPVTGHLQGAAPGAQGDGNSVPSAGTDIESETQDSKPHETIEYRLSGLSNCTANACFVNAVLQMLNAILTTDQVKTLIGDSEVSSFGGDDNEFMQAPRTKKGSLTKDYRGKISRVAGNILRAKNELGDGSIPIAPYLGRLLLSMREGNEHDLSKTLQDHESQEEADKPACITPWLMQLVFAYGGPESRQRFSGLEQEDVHEYCYALLEALADEHPFFRDLIAYASSEHMECSKCSQTLKQPEVRNQFLELSMHGCGPGKAVIPDLLNAYVDAEQLADYTCEKCGTQGSTTKRTVVRSLPDHVVIHLNRSQPDGTKITKPVDLQGFGEIEVPFTSEVYQLKAIVQHRGPNTDFGHYTTWREHQGKWYWLDDEQVIPGHTRRDELVVERQCALILLERQCVRP